TEDDVTGAVTIPDYPSDKEQPTIKVDDPSKLPDGNTPGTSNVDVTVTYPDGTQDHVTVPVTTNPEKDVIAPDAPTINQPSVGDK
ncbi:Rib/alpha-like domain-containing protein, partial [Staphylococcus caprae]